MLMMESSVVLRHLIYKIISPRASQAWILGPDSPSLSPSVHIGVQHYLLQVVRSGLERSQAEIVEILFGPQGTFSLVL